MVELLTTSYSAWRPSDGLLVRASLGAPRWFPNEGRDLPRLHVLTPAGSALGADDWALQYEARLERFGPAKIARAISIVAAEHDVVALVIGCYEADPEQCHRSVFARWWLRNTGQPVPDVTEVNR